MSYDPETPVLVAVLNNQPDWERIQTEGWYRIPVKRAPRLLAATLIAWYQTKAFGAAGGVVRWYAPIVRSRLATRRELLPGEADHPRADERYWRLELGALAELPRPIPARRFRRATFIPTRWDRLLSAHDITQLWLGDTALAELCQALAQEGYTFVRRQLRDDEPAYVAAAPGSQTAGATTLWAYATLDGAIVAGGDQELRFDYAELIWDRAGCLARLRAAFG
jgi:hypothetical protein